MDNQNTPQPSLQPNYPEILEGIAERRMTDEQRAHLLELASLLRNRPSGEQLEEFIRAVAKEAYEKGKAEAAKPVQVEYRTVRAAAEQQGLRFVNRSGGEYTTHTVGLDTLVEVVRQAVRLQETK